MRIFGVSICESLQSEGKEQSHSWLYWGKSARRRRIGCEREGERPDASRSTSPDGKVQRRRRGRRITAVSQKKTDNFSIVSAFLNDFLPFPSGKWKALWVNFKRGVWTNKLGFMHQTVLFWVGSCARGPV